MTKKNRERVLVDFAHWSLITWFIQWKNNTIFECIKNDSFHIFDMEKFLLNTLNSAISVGFQMISRKFTTAQVFYLTTWIKIWTRWELSMRNGWIKHENVGVNLAALKYGVCMIISRCSYSYEFNSNIKILRLWESY